MKMLVCLLLPITFLLNCTKEAVLPDPNSTVLDVKSQPNWTTTVLDDMYTIQFPTKYEGGTGPTIEGPEFSIKSKDGSVYLLDPLPFLRGRTPLATPVPDRITVIKQVLDRTVTFRRDGQTQGLLYYTRQPKVEGRLFLLRNGQLMSSLIVQCNAESFQEVLGILQTIQPR